MKKIIVISLFATLCGHAQADVALGGAVSTLGLGLQATFAVSERVNLRMVANGINQSSDFEESGINYNGTLDFATYGVIGDWHPFNGGFHLSAGAMHNGNQLSLDASCPQSCDIDGHSYQSAPDGQINADVDFGTFAPYLGIGWGNSMKGGRLYATLDIGVLFQETPNVELTASGSFKEQNNPFTVNTSNPKLQQELANEEKSLQQELDDTEFSNLYPVISLSVGYRF